MYAGAGRGLPGGKSLFLARPRKRNQKEGRPNIPETSENLPTTCCVSGLVDGYAKPSLPDGRRRTRLAFAILILFFVSEAHYFM